MNPSKKILNPKNNSPWLLCPSKRFPGKFYYFNGSTGETAWCLSKTDKNLSKSTIHKVTDKTHTYPEPFDPPIDDGTNTTNSFTSLKNAGNIAFHNAKENRPSPVFGQSVFSNYVPPDIFTPKFVWTLTPMYVPNQLHHRQTLDRVPQTYDQSIFVPNSSNQFQPLTSNFAPNGFLFQKQACQFKERPMFDQTTNFTSFKLSKEAQTPQTYDQSIFVPNSSNQFQPLTSNFAPNGFLFQKQACQFKERPMFDQTTNFTSFKLSKEAQPLTKPFMKDEACQTFVPLRTKRFGIQSESISAPKSILKISRSVENLSTVTKDIETSTLSPPRKVDNETGKLSELGKNDLRFKLVAKRRKVKCTTESEKAVKSADQSTSKTREDLTPMKRVTFDIEESGASHASSEDIKDTDQSPESSRMEELRQPSPDGPWYVVADTPALLTDWQCIEDFVKRDAFCRLLVPYAVYTELELRSRGNIGAFTALWLLKKMAGQASHIVVQSKPEYELSSKDSILQCCWSLLQEDCHVVLISNNRNMLNKANKFNLKHYTLDELKNGSETAAIPHIDLIKVKIPVVNGKNKTENLFMQDLSEVNGLCLPKPKGFRVRDSRMSIFDIELNSTTEVCKKDDDKLINLTKPHSKVNTVFNSEITNVKDQITKLSIAESRTVSNRTKQIMRNVFCTKEFDSKIDQATSVDIENDNGNQNLKDKDKIDTKNQNQWVVSKKVGIINEIDRDIRILNVSDKEKSRDTIKVSGISNLNNQFNLDEELERFYVKNAMVESRIKSRLEEWMCRLNQTMEGVLTEILLEEKTKIKRMMPPWSFFEAIQVTGEAFKKQPYVKAIIDQFSMKLLNCSSNNGKLNKDIKPNDFMKLIGLSVILMEHLKKYVNCKELFEADDMLVDLIRNIEDPETDIDLPMEKAATPIFSRSEILDAEAPAGFRKSRTDIEEYLKEHFAAWKTHETGNLIENVVIDKIGNEEPNVVRTCGKYLNTLKINNTTKAITVEKKADQVDVKMQPKVIRNVKIKAAFEERLKKKELDLDQLDCEENEIVHTVPVVNEGVKVNDENDKTYDLPDKTLLGDLSVSATSLNTECAKAYPLVKIFMMKIKSTLVKISDFINTTIQEYKKGMSVARKADMLLKTEITRQSVLKIAERLKNIIARESGDGRTLKDLLVKSGEYVEDDPVMTNYKQTVTKYLQQIQILEKILEHVLSLLNAVSSKEKKPYSK